MNQQLFRIIISAFVAVIAVTIFALPVAAQTPVPCPLPLDIHWDPDYGDDDYTGTTLSQPVETRKRAREEAAKGGGCIYLVENGVRNPNFIEQINSTLDDGGVALPQSILYLLLLGIATLSIIVGLWAHRKKNQLQPQLNL